MNCINVISTSRISIKLITLIAFFFLCYNNLYSQNTLINYWYTKNLLAKGDQDLKLYKKLTLEGYRIDSSAWYNSKNAILITTNIKAIPKLLKKKKDHFSVIIGNDSLASENPYNTLNRNDIRKQLLFQYDTFITRNKYLNQLNADVKQKDQDKYKKQLKRYKKDIKKFKRFLKSKTVVNTKLKTWYLNFSKISEAGISQIIFPSFQYGIKKKNIGEIHFDTLYTGFLEELLQVDTSDCTPTSFRHNFDYTLSKGKAGCGFMTNRNCFCSYRPYSKVKERKFTIKFPYNKSTFTKKDISQITTFLKDENRMIVKTKIEAYASVEGDKHRNLELQQQRANVLIRLLVKANRDSIESVIHTSENWDKFFKQIEKSKFNKWKDLSQDSIKSLLSDDSLKKVFEPLLSPEREAILFVSFADRLTKEKKLSLVRKHYDQTLKLYNKYFSIPSKRAQAVYRMAGIRSYVRYAIEKGEFEGKDICDLFKSSVPEFDIISFYQEKKRIEEGGILLCDDNTYDIIYKAYEANYKLVKENFIHPDLQKKYALQGVDIQLLAYTLISKNILPQKLSYEMDYPYDQAFAAMRINKLVFESKDYNLFNTKKTDVSKARIKASFQEEDSRLILSSYDLIQGMSNSVYPFAKGIALYPNKYEIHNNFKRFYLSSVLQMSISKWNEKELEPEKAFFDKEIDEVKMKILLGRYLSKYACPVVQNQISLTYQRKAAYHSLQINDNDLKNETIKILSIIKSYYQKRIEKITPQKVLALSRYFARFNKENYQRKGLELSLGLLKESIEKKNTSPEIINLYGRLQRIKN